MLRRSLALAVAVLVAACGGDGVGVTPPPGPVAVEGSWSGNFPADSGAQDVSLSLNLTDTKGVVTGDGTLVTAAGKFPLSVSGTYDSPRLSLAMTTAGFEPVSLVALVGERSMTGTIGGGGFTNEAFTLERKDSVAPSPI